MPPDGGGRGHFTSMAEIRAAIEDHGRRLLLVERDVIQLSDRVFAGRRVKKTRRPKPAGR